MVYERLRGISVILIMNRLNSGIFGIFKLSAFKLNLKSSDCRASKIIQNDTKLEPIPWELNMENQLFGFCVGVWVGGHHPTNFSHISKDAQENSTSFDAYEIPAARRGKKFYIKNHPKIRFYVG